MSQIAEVRSRGIQEADVFAAADALLAEGKRPTIERVRLKIGRGSPNTVSPMLERWFATLGERLVSIDGRIGSAGRHGNDAGRHAGGRAQCGASCCGRRPGARPRKFSAASWNRCARSCRRARRRWPKPRACWRSARKPLRRRG